MSLCPLRLSACDSSLAVFSVSHGSKSPLLQTPRGGKAKGGAPAPRAKSPTKGTRELKPEGKDKKDGKEKPPPTPQQSKRALPGKEKDGAGSPPASPLKPGAPPKTPSSPAPASPSPNTAASPASNAPGTAPAGAPVPSSSPLSPILLSALSTFAPLLDEGANANPLAATANKPQFRLLGDSGEPLATILTRYLSAMPWDLPREKYAKALAMCRLREQLEKEGKDMEKEEQEEERKKQEGRQAAWAVIEEKRKKIREEKEKVEKERLQKEEEERAKKGGGDKKKGDKKEEKKDDKKAKK